MRMWKDGDSGLFLSIIAKFAWRNYERPKASEITASGVAEIRIELL
jgi:hypothetical protein